MEPILLNINEVANLLGMHPNSVRNLMADGKLPFHKIGKSLRFKTEEVRKFVEDLRAENARG